MATAIAEPAAALAVPVSKVRGSGDWRNALFIVPYLIVFLVMLVVPLAMGMWLSTTKSDLFGTERWVGLSNFGRLFGDTIFLQAVANTF